MRGAGRGGAAQLMRGGAVARRGLQNEPGGGSNATTSCPSPPPDSQSAATARAARLEGKALSEVGGREPAGRERADSYSKCSYTQCNYYHAFKAVAPKIKQLDPSIRIHANSWSGQVSTMEAPCLPLPSAQCLPAWLAPTARH